jgi:signal peptide peptidase SppA
MDATAGPGTDFTRDAFHRGRFFLVQPARKGHRAGTDALLLAAAVPEGFAGRLADLGAGAGAAGLAVASRCPEARIVLVENAPEMLHCARATLALAENARLAPRCSVLEADVRLKGAARHAAGLADRSFDFVILNPPFNPASDRPSPDALRRQAHVMEDEALIADWLQTAAAITRPGGGVAIIARPPLPGRRPFRALPAFRRRRDQAHPAARRQTRDPFRRARLARGERGALDLAAAGAARRRRQSLHRDRRGHRRRPLRAVRALRQPGAGHCVWPQNAYITDSPPQRRSSPLETLPQSDPAQIAARRFGVIPVIRLHGTIMAQGSPLRPALSLAGTANADREGLFLHGRARGRDLDQLARRLARPVAADLQAHPRSGEEKKKRVIVFVEDLAASGGYMIAIAGDEIIADPSSIVGSIGVVSASFGFQEAIKKIGVERRIHTAGQNKAVLDPFKPERKEDIEHLKKLQLEVHETFIAMVKERRGTKLSDNPDLFTGLFWSGKRGLELGLVDELGDMRSVLRARFGDKVQMKLITHPRTSSAAPAGSPASKVSARRSPARPPKA